VTQFLAALVPSAGVLFLFWLGIRALVEADRRERSAQARIEADARRSAATGEGVAGRADGPAADSRE
jgi:threonine/homoserine/homoserine lactone efflux protein